MGSLSWGTGGEGMAGPTYYTCPRMVRLLHHLAIGMTGWIPKGRLSPGIYGSQLCL